MSHEPLLSTDLFEDLSIALKSPKGEPFNLLKFLFLRRDYQIIVDIYGACNGWIRDRQHVHSENPRLLDRDRERLKKLIELYRSLSSLGGEDDYWAGYAFWGTGRVKEAALILNQSLVRGYKGAAVLLASHCHYTGMLDHAEQYLDILEPFDNLSLWDRTLAYRERGNLLMCIGKFESARLSFQKSWELIEQFDDGKALVGLCAQSLATISETLGRSFDALRIIRESKLYIMPNRKAAFLYLQALAATHANYFDEAQEVLTELRIFGENDPQIISAVHHTNGVFSYCSGLIEDAVLHFRAAVATSGGLKNSAAFFATLYLVNCSIKLGNIDDAVKYFDEAEHEFIDMKIGDWLSLGYLKQAQASLYLHHGTLDVALGRASAVDHLEAALEIFGELELSRGRAQAYLQLAAWYLLKQDKITARRYLAYAHKYRKETQDITSFESSLDLVPKIKALYNELASDNGLDLTPEEQQAGE